MNIIPDQVRSEEKDPEVFRKPKNKYLLLDYSSHCQTAPVVRSGIAAQFGEGLEKQLKVLVCYNNLKLLYYRFLRPKVEIQ